MNLIYLADGRIGSGDISTHSESDSASQPEQTHEGPQGGLKAWYAVGIIALVSTMSNIDRGIINLLVEPIKRDLELSDTSVSLLVGFAFSFFYMICGLPMARVADSASRKVILTSALAIWSCATAVCGLAQTFWQLFVARGIVGGAESCKGPSSMSMIADLVPRDRLPRAFAIYQLGITAGMSGALIVGGALLGILKGMPPIDLGWIVLKDWHLVFMIAGAPGLLLALIMALTIKEPQRYGRRTAGKAPIKDVVKFMAGNWRVYVPLLLAIAIGSIETFGMVVWRPTFFERTYGWGPEIAGPLIGLMMLIATPLGLTLGAALAERLIRKGTDDAMVRVVFYSHILTVPFAVAMPLMPDPWLSFAMGLLASTAAGMGAPGQNSAFQIMTPNEMRGQVSAVYLFAISVIGGGLGPTAIALLTDNVFQDEAMLRYSMSLFAAIVGPIGVVLLWLTLRPFAEAVRRNEQQTKAENR